MTKEQVIEALAANCKKSLLQRGVITTSEAAELLGVSDATVKRMADAGVIKATKNPTGRRLFSFDAFINFVPRRNNDKN